MKEVYNVTRVIVAFDRYFSDEPASVIYDIPYTALQDRNPKSNTQTHELEDDHGSGDVFIESSRNDQMSS